MLPIHKWLIVVGSLCLGASELTAQPGQLPQQPVTASAPFGNSPNAPLAQPDEQQRRQQEQQRTRQRQQREAAARKAFLAGASAADLGILPDQRQPSWKSYQNPYAENNYLTVDQPTGAQQAPNTYYGPQFRDWSNTQLSTPQSFGVSRANISRLPPPPSRYYSTDTWNGPQWTNWQNQRLVTPTRSSTGSWNQRP